MLIGHDKARRAWSSAMEGPRLHHAWLLAGPKGVGKGTFARECARQLVGSETAHTQAARHHPDILVLERAPFDEKEARNRDEGKPYKRKRNISVDQVRNLQKRLTTRPTLGARRAVIIDPADDMEAAAANALLKSLEEPPSGNVFFLVAHRPGRLLPTIRSRCRVLRMHGLQPADVIKVLTREGPGLSSSAIEAAANASQGSPGAALTWLEEDLGKVDEAITALLRSSEDAKGRKTQLASSIGPRPTPERSAAVFDLAMRRLAEAVRSAPRGQQARIIEAHSALVTLAARAPTANFDPGLLAMEIGGLLASAARPREAA